MRNDHYVVESLELHLFFGRIMKEHALFIRGLLDPCEAELINTADESAMEFAELLHQCNSAQDQTLTEKSLEKTVKLRDFKAAGARAYSSAGYARSFCRCLPTMCFGKPTIISAC